MLQQGVHIAVQAVYVAIGAIRIQGAVLLYPMQLLHGVEVVLCPIYNGARDARHQHVVAYHAGTVSIQTRAHQRPVHRSPQAKEASCGGASRVVNVRLVFLLLLLLLCSLNLYL